MNIVCISNKFYIWEYVGIEIGNIYNVIEYLPNVHPNGRFRLEGVDKIYPKELFITLEEYRQAKLNKILNK